MSLRLQSHARGSGGHDALDAESDKAPSPGARGRGHGRGRNHGKGRGHGGVARLADEPVFKANVAGVVADLCLVHQTLETLVGLMENQEGAEPSLTQSLFHRVRGNLSL